MYTEPYIAGIQIFVDQLTIPWCIYMFAGGEVFFVKNM